TWSPAGVVDGRDLGESATSLQAATGRVVERAALLAALLTRLDTRYRELQLGRRMALFEAWRVRLTTPGQRVSVQTPTGTRTGIALDVLPDGALRLQSDDGVLHTITAGDVSA
ncbi:MAG: biotin--[acetyl-CoA-carboxylase] ligase, partial [Roseiflexaceae bacterium]|nr:biotin--[acetyl-CoA-carboxylase] ligase [Roseiflexaceae bacterium]